MMVSSSAPLPRNSSTPIPQSASDRDAARFAALTSSVRRALAASYCTANPASFSDLGPVIMAEVASQLNLLNGSGSGPAVTAAKGAISGAGVSGGAGGCGLAVSFAGAPRVFALNPVYGLSDSCNPPRRTGPVQPCPPAGWGDMNIPGGGESIQGWVAAHPVLAAVLAGGLAFGLFRAIK